jgi:hypothetical protein
MVSNFETCLNLARQKKLGVPVNRAPTTYSELDYYHSVHELSASSKEAVRKVMESGNPPYDLTLSREKYRIKRRGKVVLDSVTTVVSGWNVFQEPRTTDTRLSLIFDSPVTGWYQGALLENDGSLHCYSSVRTNLNSGMLAIKEITTIDNTLSNIGTVFPLSWGNSIGGDYASSDSKKAEIVQNYLATFVLDMAERGD